MIRKILLFFSISIFAMLNVSFCQEQESKDPCDKAQTTVEMQECLHKRHQKADKELNQVYKQLMFRLSKKQQVKLKEAQRAWILFRDKNAEFEASEEEGGSMYQLVYLSVTASMTEKRVWKIKEILKKIGLK